MSRQHGHTIKSLTIYTAASWGMRFGIGTIYSISVMSGSLYYLFPKAHLASKEGNGWGAILRALVRRQVHKRNYHPLICPFARHTKPGGWVECIDLDLEWRSPDGSLTKKHSSKYFNEMFILASREDGLDPCPGPLLEKMLKDTGFENVKAEKHVWPVGTWPADKHLVRNNVILNHTTPHYKNCFVCITVLLTDLIIHNILQKEVGAWNYLQIMEGLEAFTYALFSRVLGYSRKEIDVVCDKIRKDMKDPRMHAYFEL